MFKTRTMNKIIICWCMLLASVVQGQLYQPQLVKPKAIGHYEKALVYLRDGYVADAIVLLKKSIATDSTYLDAYLSLAGAYGELKRYQESVANYEIALQKDPVYSKLYQLPYAINLAGLGNFAQALTAIDSFLTIPNLSDRSINSAKYRRNCFQFAVNRLAKNLPHFTFNPINLGDSVNSPQSEYFPCLTVNDSMLVFTRRGAFGKGEYFFQSNMLANHAFGKSESIKGSLNQEPMKGAITLSADGEWMIFAGNLTGKSFGSYDLYISYNTPQGWSDPENLGENINTSAWESSPSLSPDNKVLYFASNRDNGFGGSDLYMSVRGSNGKWCKAINMGPLVNTPGDEQAPFIHADNQTLFFSSTGLPGYGGSDLFVMRKNPLGIWQSPENLGYPINTIENEGSLAVASDGETAYYASDRSDSRGGLDLYMFQLPEYARPIKTLFVKGRIYDASTLKGIPCGVELIQQSNGKPLMQFQTDELGKYFITLPIGSNYIFSINRKGYLFYNTQYLFANKLPDSTYVHDIALHPLQVNTTTVLNHILFQSNEATLLPSSKIELDKVFQLLTDNPTLRIQITGHTDNIGKPADNGALSQKRALSVVTYLTDKGIAQQRLITKGMGAVQPVASNDTESGRALNRRIEMTILAF
jgi:outer membrane protein OmpA-like peptidoglycan-associated protein/tetratricopeptide (TPR) repeat protein